MAGFIFLDSTPVIDNPWAVFASMLAALFSCVVAMKSKRFAPFFYTAAAVCTVFGLLITYSQNNLAKIGAERDVAIDREKNRLWVSDSTTRILKKAVEKERDTCFIHYAQLKKAHQSLTDTVAELRRDNRAYRRDLSKLNAVTYDTKKKEFYPVRDPETGLWGFRKHGEKLTSVEFVYKDACDFSCERAGVKNKHGKWGYVDKSLGKSPLIPFIFDAAFAFCNDKAVVRYKGEWITINKLGQKIGTAKGKFVSNL